MNTTLPNSPNLISQYVGAEKNSVNEITWNFLAFQELFEANDEESARELLQATRPLLADASLDTPRLLTALNVLEAGLNLGNVETRESGRRMILKVLAPKPQPQPDPRRVVNHYPKGV